MNGRKTKHMDLPLFSEAILPVVELTEWFPQLECIDPDDLVAEFKAREPYLYRYLQHRAERTYDRLLPIMSERVAWQSAQTELHTAVIGCMLWRKAYLLHEENCEAAAWAGGKLPEKSSGHGGGEVNHD
jgi:hypothetical protein